MSILQIPSSSVTFIDPITGGINIQWQNFLQSLTTISGNFAPLDARYWVSTANSDLTNETNLGSLTTGYMKLTVAAAVGTPSTVTTIPGADVLGSALTRTNDTNVTVTLGGTPASALLAATSLTLGWTGTLGLARGGTNVDLSATGGTGQVLQQSTVGGNITVGTISGSAITGAALTRTNDTNVTVTLGGSPTTALLNAASLTLGWTGQLGLSRGGSNADLSATGGTNQLVKQNSVGAAFTVGTIASANLSDTANIPLLNAANVFSNTTGQEVKKLILDGSTSGSVTVAAAAVAGTNTLTLPAGTTDFSATGGTNQVVKQSSAGAALTVGTLASTNLSDVSAQQTFTPVLSFGGASVGITYSAQIGRYLAIGKYVFFQITLILTSKGSSTGTASIGGLPATSKNVTNSYATIPMIGGGFSAISFTPIGYIAPNTTAIVPTRGEVSGGLTALTDAEFTNSTNLLTTGFYETE